MTSSSASPPSLLAENSGLNVAVPGKCASRAVAEPRLLLEREAVGAAVDLDEIFRFRSSEEVVLRHVGQKV